MRIPRGPRTREKPHDVGGAMREPGSRTRHRSQVDEEQRPRHRGWLPERGGANHEWVEHATISIGRLVHVRRRPAGIEGGEVEELAVVPDGPCWRDMPAVDRGAGPLPLVEERLPDVGEPVDRPAPHLADCPHSPDRAHHERDAHGCRQAVDPARTGRGHRPSLRTCSCLSVASWSSRRSPGCRSNDALAGRGRPHAARLARRRRSSGGTRQPA